MIFPSDLPEATLWEAIAEEAVEFAHEAQKLARILRGENPSDDLPQEDYRNHLDGAYEEWADLNNISKVLNLRVDEYYAENKMKRWISRLNDEKSKIKKEV